MTEPKATHWMQWKWSLNVGEFAGEFAAWCPSQISPENVADVLEFIDLVRRGISRLGPPLAFNESREAPLVSTQNGGMGPAPATAGGQTPEGEK